MKAVDTIEPIVGAIDKRIRGPVQVVRVEHLRVALPRTNHHVTPLRQQRTARKSNCLRKPSVLHWHAQLVCDDMRDLVLEPFFFCVRERHVAWV